MKSKLVILLTVVAAVALMAPPGWAAITGSPHDLSGAATGIAKAGVCSPCHIPHGGGANRLWPVQSSTLAGAGIVGNLCASCHYSTGAYGGDGAVTDALSNAYVFGGSSHGVLMNPTGIPDQNPTYLDKSSLPYIDDNSGVLAGKTMECTTCHNVHDNGTNQPFLRLPIESLCSDCHANRHYVAGANVQGGAAPANWVIGNTRAGNPGSHPVGADVTSAWNGTWTSITINTIFENAFGTSTQAAGVGDWVAGGHLNDGTLTGGVTCVTCHAVHGQKIDLDNTGQNPAVNAVPNTNFLVIDQASSTPTATPAAISGRSVANGAGLANPLCTGCHNGSLSVDYGNASALAGSAFDPGASGYTHPLMGIIPNGEWVTAFPTFWPTGSTTTYNTGNTPVAICESCHTPHPLANQNATVQRDDIVAIGATNYGFITRDATADLCANCHLAGGNSAHHPVGMTYDSSGVGGGSTSPLVNVTGAAGDVLSCSTCHANSGAHNWTGMAVVGLDTNWKPLNNARSTVAATDAIADSMSVTCINCHNDMDSDAANFSPTMHALIGTEPQYQIIGQGTHYLGWTLDTPAVMSSNLQPRISSVYNTAGYAWSDSTNYPGANGGWPRFATDAGNGLGLVCESCHELQPAKNNGAGGHLLLADFVEGQNGNDPAGQDGLCVACHQPPGTHPTTGSNVSRTGAPLNIDTTKAWLTTYVSGSKDATWDIGNNKLSCDSCHQVHDANTQSAAFILDALDADVSLNATDYVPPGSIPDGTSFVPYYPDGTKPGDYATFCAYCHPYQ